MGFTLDPASTEKKRKIFFPNFDLILQYVSPLDLWIWDLKEKFFLSIPEVCFLDAARFVPLVLAGVRVAGFLGVSNLDLIFFTQHSYTDCLSVCWPVCHSFLSVLSVYLSVCLSYVQYCRYVQYGWILVFLYICLFFSLFQHFWTVRLSVCLSVYVCTSLFLFVCMYICTSVFQYLPLSVFLPAFLHSCVPSCLPVCLSTRLTACLSSCLPSCLPFCLPSCLPAHLPACLPAWIAAEQ